MKTKKFIMFFLLILFSISGINCATRKMYSGDMPREKTATVFEGSNARIISFDGVNDGTLSSLEILPGKHRLKADFVYNSSYVKRMDGYLYQITYKSKSPIEIEFEVFPGKTYYVEGKLDSSELCRIEIKEGFLFDKKTVSSKIAVIEEVYEPYYAERNYYDDYYRSSFYRREPFFVHRWPYHCW